MSGPVPNEVALLDARLGARGYRVVSERHDDARFGDAEVVFERERTLVRVVRDRGQWFVEAKATTWDEWFAPTIWRAMLTAAMRSIDAVSFDGQVQLLLDDLDRIEHVTDDPSGTELGELQLWRARRAEARRALPPDAGMTA